MSIFAIARGKINYHTSGHKMLPRVPYTADHTPVNSDSPIHSNGPDKQKPCITFDLWPLHLSWGDEKIV